MGLEIAQEQQETVNVLALRGRLDTDTSADLELAAQDLFGAGARFFLIDLADVGYVSSAGLRVLLALAKQLEAGRGALRLCGLNASVTQVFEVAGFSRLFAISRDRATALAAMLKTAPKPAAPTLAQTAAKLLRVADLPVPRTQETAELARDVAQLLGVRPSTSAAASRASAAVPAIDVAERAAPPPPASTGMLGKLRGMLGGKPR